MIQPRRICLALALAVSSVVLLGCPPVPNPNETQPGKNALSDPAHLPPEAPTFGFEPVARGVFVPVSRTPLTVEMLNRAKTPREKVYSALKAQLEAAAARPSPQPADAVTQVSTKLEEAAKELKGDAPEQAETPPLAVKYYLQGRARFLEGANSEAMVLLENALQLDPNAFTVLRLMGRVCFAASQLSRGVTYLDRAHALRPTDVEVNYLLGRYWMERNDFNRAAFFLLQAQDSPDRQMTSTQTPLSSFYLAISLQGAGYHLAAAKENEHFLELAQLPIAGYRYDAELAYLVSLNWASQLAAAENFARIGDYRNAVPHYRQASAGRPDDPFIASRLVNALVNDNQGENARKAALVLLRSTKGADDGVKLLEWTYTATGKRNDLLKDLATAYKTNNSDEAKAEADVLALAAALDYLGKKGEAFSSLRAFLETHPKRTAALDRLLKRVDSAETFSQALRVAGLAISADSALTEAVVQIYRPVSDGPWGGAYLKSAFAARTAKLSYAEFYLQALTRRAHNDTADSIEFAIKESVKSSPPEFFASRQALVSQLLAEEKFSEADKLIVQITQSPAAGEKAWQLRIDAEIAQQRLSSAQALAKDARARYPMNTDFRMQLAAIYRVRGLDKDVETELNALIRDVPKFEPGYRQLVATLFQRGRRGAGQDATTAAVVATVNKLLAEIPDSRFARVTAAVVYARNGRLDDAQSVLKSVLAADPDSAEALVPMAQVMQLAGSTGGPEMLEASLKRKPQIDVVRALATIYRDQNRKGEALVLTRRMADENPDVDAYAVLHAVELTSQDKRPEAAAYLTELLKQRPRSQVLALQLADVKETLEDIDGAIATVREFIKVNGESSERLYVLGHLYSKAGNDDASVATMQRVLAIMPDHIGANNDLGYFWANLGIHLEQAEPMIRKAVDAKPDNAAFTDSLGWLYYKQGKFSDAAVALEKAVSLPGGSSPEVIRHLGDALYRLNRQREATERWAQALQQLSIIDSPSKVDRDQQEYLNRVLSEARAERPAPVSPIAQPDAAKAAGPAVMPATSPQ